MNPIKLIEERLPICEACEFLEKKTKCCRKVAKTNHLILLGYILHENGIKNPKARCPIGKWTYYPSTHAKAVEAFIELPDSLRREITIKGITTNNELTFTSKLFAHAATLGLTIKRAEILAKLREIKAQPNKV